MAVVCCRFGLRKAFALSSKCRKSFSEFRYVGGGICNPYTCIPKSKFSTELNTNIYSFEYQHGKKAKRFLVYGGILATLGLKTEEKEEDKLIHTIKLGILSLQEEDFNTAERILHAALKIAQEREDPQAVTYIYDILGNVAFKKGDLKKAETLLVETMKRSVSAGMSTEDNAIVEISLKLASIFDQQKNFAKAEEGYRFCIDTQQKKIDKINFSEQNSLTELEQDTLLLWAMSRDWYGRHLLAMGKLKEAQENFVKAYEMSQRINGPLHHQTLVLMNDIGSIATLREQFNEAIYYLEKAIENGKLAKTPDLAAFYCNLGATLMKKGDLNEALKCCKNGLRLAKSADQEEAITDARECIEELKKLGVK